MVQGSEYPAAIGIELTFRADGTLTSPLLGGDTALTWHATDDRVAVDDGSYAMGANYTIENDTMIWLSEDSGPFVFMTFEYRFERL
jgi:hypothetical protein